MYTSTAVPYIYISRVGLGGVRVGWVGLGWVGLGEVGLGLVWTSVLPNNAYMVDDSYKYPAARVLSESH